jgi:hypothetical protein
MCTYEEEDGIVVAPRRRKTGEGEEGAKPITFQTTVREGISYNDNDLDWR